jgi:hypothetical protein
VVSTVQSAPITTTTAVLTTTTTTVNRSSTTATTQGAPYVSLEPPCPTEPSPTIAPPVPAG